MKTGLMIAILLGLSISGFSYFYSSAQAQDSATAETFIARGVEPFWSIQINRDQIIFSTPNIQMKKYTYIAPQPAQNRPLDLLRVYRLKGQPSGTLIIRKVDACSDTMSDKVYPYSAILLLGNQVFDGCAERQ